MLTYLSITNYAIIEQLELEFTDGFTVITGETGAGKSILLGALSMVLGQRADTSVLNNKSKKCIIEGHFVLEKEIYQNFFYINDLDFETHTIIRREINANGKSRAFINDTPVTINILKELASELVDIHSQHQTLQIKNNAFQISVLDAFVGNNTLLSEYQKDYFEYKKELTHLHDLQINSTNYNSDKDYIQYQVNEIEELRLKPNEKEEIEKELDLINNSEEIKRVLSISDNLLSNSEQCVLQLINELDNQFIKIINCSSQYNDIYNRIKTLSIELDDVAKEISSHNENFNLNTEDLNLLNEKLSKIYSIEKKHRVNSTSEILDLLKKFKEQLKEVDSYDEKINEQNILVNKLKEEVGFKAKQLSEIRNKAKSKLEQSIQSTVYELGMPNSEFKIQLSPIKEPNQFGIDHVEFLFTANKGVEVQELNNIASGGELSRVMLTLKSILVKTKKLPTIIFDEIDTGVSGDIADKMADKMSNIAVQSQVLAITHLPQVAAKGKQHFRVYKYDKDDRTLTNVEKLSKQSRIEEIAKMLSGKSLTEQARENARVLLND